MGREMRGRVAGALMGHHLLQRRLELVVRDVLRDGVGEDVAHQRVERGGVAVRQLRQRVDAQRLDHEHRLLGLVERSAAARLLLRSNQLAADAEHRLEGAEPPVVVLLRREQLLREREDRDELHRERLRVGEAFGVEHHLKGDGNVGEVRCGRCGGVP